MVDTGYWVYNSGTGKSTYRVNTPSGYADYKSPSDVNVTPPSNKVTVSRNTSSGTPQREVNTQTISQPIQQDTVSQPIQRPINSTTLLNNNLPTSNPNRFFTPLTLYDPQSQFASTNNYAFQETSVSPSQGLVNMNPPNLVTPRDLVGTGYATYGAYVFGGVVNPVREKLGMRPLEFDYEYVKGVGSTAFDVQVSLTEGYIGGVVVGKGLGLLPAKSLKFVASKPVTYSLTGLYVGSAGYNVVTSSNPVGTGLSEAAGFVGFTSGLKQGLGSSSKVMSKLLMERSKSLNVDKVEAFSVNSKTADFGKNIGVVNNNGLDLFSSKSSGGGVGIFKVKNQFFKVGFNDVGKSFVIDEGTLGFSSTSKLRIQKYDYGYEGLKITPERVKVSFFRANVGRPFEAKIDTVGKVVVDDNGFVLRSLSEVSSNRFSFNRLLKVSGSTSGEVTSFSGQSADVLKSKVLSKSLVKGQSETTLRYDTLTSSGEPFIYSESTTKELAISRKPFDNAFLKDVKSNVKSFRKEQFTSSSESLLGLKSVQVNQQVATTITPNVDTQLRSIVGRQDVKMYRLASKSVGSNLKLGTVSVSKPSSVEQPLSFSSKSMSSFKPVSVQEFTPISVQSPKSILSFSFQPTVKNVSRYDNSLRQSPKLNQDNILNLKSEQSLGLKQSLNLRQSQLQQSRQVQTTRNVLGSKLYNPIPTTPTIGIPNFNFDSGMSSKPLKSFKPSKKSSLKVGYFPSIEAALFNIRTSKGVNLKQAYSGLTLRPIKVGGG